MCRIFALRVIVGGCFLSTNDMKAFARSIEQVSTAGGVG
jgi:hypothetical protein